ncbi:hypothetical protein L1987_58518 [Smallanthus sonchifolius]|uniref:Uncharacterized protein n=1 Tax=Smallanthus sonchifolius TaxID=185202 RepID=A0ACB9DGK8_9ASTR|nr:hypothetical protein L1987_58518 [Smallanthus sonchifolius]
MSQFRKEFHVPEHCDATKISAKFEGSILYVKQPRSTTQTAKQESKPPMNTPATVPENPKVHQDSKPSLLTQPNGNCEEKVGGLKDPKGVCENASMLKPSRNVVIKVLVVVVGFVVGILWTKEIMGRMA